MAKIPDKIQDKYGEPIDADPHGNNFAFKCFKCEYPVIATAHAIHGRGWSKPGHQKQNDPAECKKCDTKYEFVFDNWEKPTKVTVTHSP